MNQREFLSLPTAELIRLGKPLPHNPFLKEGYANEGEHREYLLDKCKLILAQAQAEGYLLGIKPHNLGNGFGKRILLALCNKRRSFATTPKKKFVVELLQNWPEPVTNLTKRVEFRKSGAYVFLKADPPAGRSEDLFLFIPGRFSIN